ncbi:hypothetical protein D3C77_542690 [compost metagenome]
MAQQRVTALEGKTMQKLVVSVHVPMYGGVVPMNVQLMIGCGYYPLIQDCDGAPFVAISFH